MIAQFQSLKASHPGALLFFRMGDFYELFFDDAIAAAAALDIALTKRGQHQGQDIPMCGVPVHNAELYLHRLIRSGFKVAVCEQMEDPAQARQRKGKTLVRRDVVRIVTPGTLTEDGLLDARRNNYLVALAFLKNGDGAAWVDVSTGRFVTEAIAEDQASALLARLDPGEILIAEEPPASAKAIGYSGDFADRVTRVSAGSFESVRAERRLASFFEVASLDAFGSFSRAEIAAAGALLDYLELTQKGALPRLERPVRMEPDRYLRLDPATMRNLEITRKLSGEREGSLVATIDRTLTGAGSRLLVERLCHPLADPPAIRDRLDALGAMIEDPATLEGTSRLLRGLPDLERAVSRLALGRGGPRDLVMIARALERARELEALLGMAGPPLEQLASALDGAGDLRARIDAVILDDPPLLAREGGFVRSGVSAELDEVRGLRDSARAHVTGLERRYREATGIASLKIRHNTMLGFFIEVTTSQAGRVPAEFIQRQSMANAVRFTTVELGELESRITGAAARAVTIETELFDALCEAVRGQAAAIAASARALAEIDLVAALAVLADERRWVRPVVDDSLALEIEDGRHPVVEAAIEHDQQRFVANGLKLDEDDRVWLLTGPNMAGKSTFLRQNALIVLLAQIGSFVPASRVRIGVVDRLFSRVGAADDLARGRSTFMVEMVETAAILNAATERSFVILDEIGRGTATFDGLSIAWAVVEHLHEVNRSRSLFATHYHELTALAAMLDGLSIHSMKVKEWRGAVVFLHEVASGSADRSYGVHVARLAGLPRTVTRRAAEILERLEAGEARSAPARLADDLPLFAANWNARPPAQAAGEPARDQVAARVREAIDAIDPDRLSPREALEQLYRLKGLIDAGAAYEQDRKEDRL